jgi:6-phosphogluconolactonase (cycloisomerase 2 family)
LQYAATALFSDGSTQDASSTATWSSSSTSVASINNTGLATGVGLGTTNIGASFKGVIATSEPLGVDQLNSITLSPSSPGTVPQGSSVQFTAIGNFTFASGGTSDLDVSSQVTWASSNTAVATVDNTGNVTAVAQGGPINITATSCDSGTVGTAQLTVGQAAATSLVVTPATITISTGSTTLFTVMEMLSNGTTQPVPQGTVVTWSSDTTGVSTVDAISGVALGITAGTANITASSAGLTSGSAVLTVQAAAARFAYVANSLGANNSGSISGYTVDVTAGTLKPLTGSPFSASLPQQVLIHPSGDFMYYLDFNGALHVLDISSADGSVTDPHQAAVGASPTASANVGVIDPTGRFIYVISDVGNSIYCFSIAQTTDQATNGAPTLIQIVSAPTDPTLNSPTWIMTDRTGKYVYVVNSLGNSVSEYAITQTGASAGALSPLGTSSIPTGSGPVYGTTDVNGHLYVANNGTSAQSVSGYSIGSNGQLTSVGADFIVTGAVATINVLTDPTGNYLYVLDADAGGNGQVFAYNLNTSTGLIGSEIGTTAQSTQIGPFGLAIDPTGALLAIDNNVSNTISLFKVAAAGSTTPPPGGLTPANPPTAATDIAPLFVTFYTAASGQ